MKRASIFLMLIGLAGLPIFSQEQPAPPVEQPPPPAPEMPPPAPVTPPPAPAQPSGAPVVTLGEFAIRAASGLGMQPPQGGFTPESAAWALVQKGIKVRPDLATPLTEADAVDALSRLGFKIRTTTPSRVVSRDRFEILCGNFFKPVAAPAATPSKVEAVPPAGKQ